MLFFTVITITWMITVQESLATIFGFFFAVFLSTYVRMRVFSECYPTEPAFLRLFFFLKLFACFPNMIRLFHALRAEIFLALRTSHSVHTHMFQCSLVNVFSIVIFISLHLSFKDFYQISTGTFYKIMLSL